MTKMDPNYIQYIIAKISGCMDMNHIAPCFKISGSTTTQSPPLDTLRCLIHPFSPSSIGVYSTCSSFTTLTFVDLIDGDLVDGDWVDDKDDDRVRPRRCWRR